MALIRRNIWTLFVLFVVLSSVMLAVIAVYRWQGIVHDAQAHHQARVSLIANASHSAFLYQEMLLEFIGRELLQDITHNELMNSQHSPLLDHLLKINTSITAFGLALPDGELVRVSSNGDLENLPNLLFHPASRDSFLHALRSPKMVLGRTYFMPALNEWVIPLRKALRDEQGNVVAVMTAGVHLERASDVFSRPLSENALDNVVMFRDRDGYIQYTSFAQSDNIHDLYDDAQDNSVVNAVQLAVQQVSKLDLAALKASGEVYPYRVNRGDRRLLGAAAFDNRFELWLISEVDEQLVWDEFCVSFRLYMVLFLVLQVLAAWLFRSIANKEKEQREQLVHMANHDALTQLLNRHSLSQITDEYFKTEQPFSLLFIDMDSFKGVNDNFGHDCGDQVLIELARRLRVQAEPDDVLARLGGDEFALICPHVERDVLSVKVERLIAAATHVYSVYGFEFQLGVSVGIAIYPEHGSNLNGLLRSADIAMYEAKKQRNSLCFYADNMEKQYLRNIKIEQALRLALQNNELSMVYQPQVNSQGRLLGVEALVRWHSAELGFVPPDQFISVAEHCGLMLPIGNFIIRQTLTEMHRLQTELGQVFDVAINISLRQFTQPGFVESVLYWIDQQPLARHSITLEVTESLFIEDIDLVLPLFQTLHDAGIRISLDDFGTGYSSLSVLRQLPLDELKVDKSFVDHICVDNTARQMIQSIISIGKNYQMTVLAEGVETEEQANLLHSFGCDRFQGYYFARPMRVDDLRIYLQA
ncbi:MAG: EAL domain-containing protein [Bacterioplanes sp.]|nr:EAL domain-containing protein [Bacterioplanes sp.]